MKHTHKFIKMTRLFFLMFFLTAAVSWPVQVQSAVNGTPTVKLPAVKVPAKGFSFGTPVETAFNIYPDCVLTGDFNGDLKSDTVMVSSTDEAECKVFLMTSRGNGTFKTEEYLLAGSIYSLTKGDFNNDGREDIAALTYREQAFSREAWELSEIHEVSLIEEDDDSESGSPAIPYRHFYRTILVGRQDGRFNVLPSVEQFDRGAGKLCAGDFNNDGNTDLAVITFGHSQIVYFKEDKTITSAEIAGPSIIPASDPSDLEWEVPELITTGSYYIMIKPGNGDLTFDEGTLTEVRADWEFGDVVAEDLNMDDRDDLVVYWNEPQLIQPIDLTGSSQEYDSGFRYHLDILTSEEDCRVTNTRSYEEEGMIEYMGVDDYNSNGKIDLIMLCDRKAMLMCGVGNGTFHTAEAFSFTEQAAAMCTGDYNGDGSSDVALINFNESIVSVLLHQRSGNFAAPVEGILREWPDFSVSGDFTGDGRQDLMLVKNEQKIVVVPSRPAVSLTTSKTSQSLRLRVTVPKEKPVLQWNPAKSDSSIGRFDIYRCTVSEGDLFVPITRVAAGARSYTDISALEGETYYYFIKVINKDGVSGLDSNKAFVKVPVPYGFERDEI